MSFSTKYSCFIILFVLLSGCKDETGQDYPTKYMYLKLAYDRCIGYEKSFDARLACTKAVYNGE